MGQSMKYTYTEPTIWALRKNTKQVRDATHSLYEHLYGYDPIRVPEHDAEEEESVRKGSAENPNLNILDSTTNFIAVQLASKEASKA